MRKAEQIATELMAGCPEESRRDHERIAEAIRREDSRDEILSMDETQRWPETYAWLKTELEITEAARLMGRKGGRVGGRSRNPEKTKHLKRGQPKLTLEEVAEIRASKLSTAQLAAQYAGRIGARQIARIRKGESWR